MMEKTEHKNYRRCIAAPIWKFLGYIFFKKNQNKAERDFGGLLVYTVSDKWLACLVLKKKKKLRWWSSHKFKRRAVPLVNFFLRFWFVQKPKVADLLGVKISERLEKEGILHKKSADIKAVSSFRWRVFGTDDHWMEERHVRSPV